jgi:hypothetical protein
MGDPRILITSVAAGAGHVKAAEALQKAFTINYPDFVVKNVDGSSTCEKRFRQ